jgi:hypothetical protein
LVGGAGEETVIARVGEGMVSTIGSAETHKDVLENPDHISKHVLQKGLDAGTAYEILSIDIADVDVGENVGAKLQIVQANADKQIAQAKAEQRRAMAVAAEQEMRARVVEAEAEVPHAMAEAFRHRNLGVMDYYRMKNVQADTTMRDAIAGGDGTTPPTGTKGLSRRTHDAGFPAVAGSRHRVDRRNDARGSVGSTGREDIGGQATRAARIRPTGNRAIGVSADTGGAPITGADGARGVNTTALPPVARAASNGQHRARRCRFWNHPWAVPRARPR